MKEIEEALLAGEIDLAVHSAKDVPGELPDGLAIVGVPERADPRDALCGAASLAELPRGARRWAPRSLRRRSQLLALRPDLEVRELRGNVDTRLRKLADGDYDAIVLAAAGLARLGRGDEGDADPGRADARRRARAAWRSRPARDDARRPSSPPRLTDRDALVALTAERALVDGARRHLPHPGRRARRRSDGGS